MLAKLSAALTLLSLSLSALAADAPRPPSPFLLNPAMIPGVKPPAMGAQRIPAGKHLHEWTPGSFVLGDLRMDKVKRLLSIPATFQPGGAASTCLLAKGGGTEPGCLIHTTATPAQVRAAMMFLGADGQDEAAPDGNAVDLSIVHFRQGRIATLRPDALFQAVAAPVDWRYTGGWGKGEGKGEPALFAPSSGKEGHVGHLQPEPVLTAGAPLTFVVVVKP